MKRIVRLTESDLTRIVRRVISEQTQSTINVTDYGPAEGSGRVEFRSKINLGGRLYYQCVTQDGYTQGRIYDYDDKDVTAQVKLTKNDYDFLRPYCNK